MIKEINKFYKTNFGYVTKKLIINKLQNLKLDNKNILIIGYPFPFTKHLANNKITASSIYYSKLSKYIIHDYRYPFNDDEFDIVIYINYIENISKQSKSVKETYRILKDEGKVICFTPRKILKNKISTKQINILMKSFNKIESKNFLFTPYTNSALLLNYYMFFENIGNLLFKFTGKYNCSIFQKRTMSSVPEKENKLRNYKYSLAAE